MRVFAYIASVILSTALIFGGVLLLVLVGDAHATVLEVLLSTLPLVVFVYGPLMLGSLAAYWNFNASPESRSYFRRWIWVIAGLEILGAIAFVVYTVLSGAPAWLAVLFIGGAAVLLAAALLIGRALLRQETRRGTPDAAWAPITREELRRKIVRVGITFVIALVVAGVGLSLLEAPEDGNFAIAFVASQALEFALFAAAFACIIMSLGIARQLRGLAGGDAGLLRTFGRVVLRGKKVELTESQQEGAAKYAATMRIFLPFQVTYIALLYAGILIGQVTTLAISRHPSALGIPTIIVLVVILAVVAPIMVVRTRRSRTYAEQHADLLPATSAATGE
ncbi:MAG: hypothetical protein JWN36_1008 [Microbacteriaceae bacterium]|nr:hypothetical protein [Microbacteriaceae bacterium]